MSRQWYEVRVREQVGPEKWVKKSKFYFVKGPGDAAKKYRGPGLIMNSQKVPREKLLGLKSPKEKALGLGPFFGLGDQLLKDLRRGGGLLEEIRQGEKSKKRGYYGRKRKETTN